MREAYSHAMHTQMLKFVYKNIEWFGRLRQSGMEKHQSGCSSVTIFDNAEMVYHSFESNWQKYVILFFFYALLTVDQLNYSYNPLMCVLWLCFLMTVTVSSFNFRSVTLLCYSVAVACSQASKIKFDKSWKTRWLHNYNAVIHRFRSYTGN